MGNLRDVNYRDAHHSTCIRFGDMCGVKVLPLSEEGRLPGLEDNFWYHHLLL
jgi:hypothetical protein